MKRLTDVSGFAPLEKVRRKPTVRPVGGKRGIKPCPAWTPTKESPGRNSEGSVFLFHWEYDWFIPETYEEYLDSGWVAFMLDDRKRKWKKHGDAYWSPAWRSDWEEALRCDNAGYLNGRIGYGPQKAKPDELAYAPRGCTLDEFVPIFRSLWFAFFNSQPHSEKIEAYYANLSTESAARLEKAAKRLQRGSKFPTIDEWAERL